jgi:hypothetical protein
MKTLLIMVIFFSQSTFSQVYSENQKEVLYQRNGESDSKRSFVQEKAKPKKKARARQRGNLPSYFSVRSEPKDISIIAPQGKGKVPGLLVGDVLQGVIPHSVIAFPDEKAPVLAEVIAGKFRGATLVGHSKLEQNSKRVFIEFTHMTYKKQTVEIAATALTRDGQPGFVGEYHSQELKYFTGDFLSSMTAAYFDSLVPRYRTLLGNIEDNSPDSALKKGLAAGANASAERFREMLSNSPEYVTLSFISNILVVIKN